MKFNIEDIYEIANKIAKSTSNSYGRSNVGNIMLQSEELYGDMMVKLIECLEHDKYQDKSHFYKNYKIACSNMAKSKITQEKNTQRKGCVVDEYGETHKISEISLQLSVGENEEMDMSDTIKVEGGLSALEEIMIEEARFQFSMMLKDSEYCDDVVLDVLKQWTDPDFGLTEKLQSEKASTPVMYHKTVREYLKMTKDMYNYAKDIILSQANDLLESQENGMGFATA